MPEVVLRVRRRLTLTRDGALSSCDSVFCPARRCSIDVARCKTCAHVRNVSAEVVACKPPGCVLPAGPDAPAAFAAVARVTLVRADVPADAIAHHHQDTPWRLPVVDEGDRFVGFFMGGGAQGPQWPWQRAAVALARDLVVGESLLLVETEPVGNALRLMARRGVRSLALADESGVFQGVLFDVDALRAFAG